MINYAVYSTVSGSPTSRPVLRWGTCEPSSLALQAGANEAAVDIGTWKMFSSEDPDVIITNLYNPTTNSFGVVGVASDADAGLVRRQRNQLLADTDYTQLPDVPISTALRGAFATYRQALRDVPSQPSFPASVTWPTRPVYVKT